MAKRRRLAIGAGILFLVLLRVWGHVNRPHVDGIHHTESSKYGFIGSYGDQEHIGYLIVSFVDDERFLRNGADVSDDGIFSPRTLTVHVKLDESFEGHTEALEIPVHRHPPIIVVSSDGEMAHCELPLAVEQLSYFLPDPDSEPGRHYGDIDVMESFADLYWRNREAPWDANIAALLEENFKRVGIEKDSVSSE